MVVCNTGLVPPVPASCPVTPILHAYSQTMCSMSPAQAVTYQHRFPATTLIPTSQIVPITSPVVSYGQDFSTPSYYNGHNVSPTVLSPPFQFPFSPSVPPPQPSLPPAMIQYPANSVSPTVIPCSIAKAADVSSIFSPVKTIVSGGMPASNRPTTIMGCGPRIFGQEAYSPGICSVISSIYSGTPGTPINSIYSGTPGTPISSIYPGTPGTPISSIYPGTPGTPIRSISPDSFLFSSLKICMLSPTVFAVKDWKQSYGMENVWEANFQTLFSQYIAHMWLLHPVDHAQEGTWNLVVDSAKVRFCCNTCGHGWTSMKGRVAFWYNLNPTLGEGTVKLKLYGQQCDRCKTNNYELPMWYPEEVTKVLVNVYNKVGQTYYGFHQAPYHRTRRPGKPRTPHNSELCQACKDGVCSERK